LSSLREGLLLKNEDIDAVGKEIEWNSGEMFRV